jgi:hypothetical protein
MITCCIRYTIDLDKIAQFEHYARTWMGLIEKHGGIHHGYFIPSASPPSQHFSFPGIGEAGAGDEAIALFSFDSVAEYETYRREVADDPECAAATDFARRENPFTRYVRTFLHPVVR